MKISLKEAADLVGGVVYGNPDLEISGIAKIDEANNGDLTFLYLPQYEASLSTTKASAVLISSKFNKRREDISYIEVKEPNVAFSIIIRKYFTPKLNLLGIDSSSAVHLTAKIGQNVAIGKNVVVCEGCEIGDDTFIFHNSVIMENVKIGKNGIIFPNVTIRENCILGDDVIIHSNTCIGSDGFGYVKNSKGEYEKVPQIGNVVLEDFVELGSNVSVDRAALGSTVIKRGTKVDNLVQIAHNVVIGENSVLISQSGVAGSTTIGKNFVLAGQAGVVGHIEITDDVIVTAQSGVSKSIEKAGQYRGSPAQPLRETLKMEARIRNLEEYERRIKILEEKIAFLEGKNS